MAKDMLTFDAGDLSDDQLMTVMAVANIAKARMDAVEKGCKAVLVGRMETGHQPAMLDGEELADIQRTAGGGDGGWVVKDAEAYGAWLDRQEGMEDFVRRRRCRPPMRWTPDSWDPSWRRSEAATSPTASNGRPRPRRRCASPSRTRAVRWRRWSAAPPPSSACSGPPRSRHPRPRLRRRRRTNPTSTACSRGSASRHRRAVWLGRTRRPTTTDGDGSGGRRREEDPDIQFLRLKARKARPAKALLWGILVALLIVIYLLQNPVAQNVDIPAVDYNPAGKQAAYKLTEIWLKDNPLGKNAVITSWDGCKETTYKDGDRTIPVYRHDLTVESSLGWWTVHATIRTDSNGLLGYPSATRKGLPNTATPNGNITWPRTLSDATASDALSRLLTQWGQAYVGHDADMLTTIVKDPDTRIKYRPLRLSDKAQATVDQGPLPRPRRRGQGREHVRPRRLPRQHRTARGPDRGIVRPRPPIRRGHGLRRLGPRRHGQLDALLRRGCGRPGRLAVHRRLGRAPATDRI